MNGGEEQFLPGVSHARIWLVLALCFAAVMPSHDSIWIDEAQTAVYASQPTASAWRNRLLSDHASEAQMPLGMAVAWLGAKIMGTGEWQLRSINILWTTATIWMVWLVGCRFRAPALALVAAVNPFLWFYANEARPYSLQIAGGACLLLAGIKFFADEGKGVSWAALWSVAAIILCSSSMLGVIPFGVMSAWLGFSIAQEKRWPERRALLVMSVTLAVLSFLGCYYLWTLKRGAGGALLWPVGLGNLAFSGYELLGFAGLGPARQTLRDASANGSLSATFQPYLIALGLISYATVLIFARAFSWFRLTGNRSLAFLLLGLPVLSTLLLFVLAKAVHFPFWGRHLAPLAPFIIAGLGLPALLSKKFLARLSCVLWLALMLLSALELRFASRHTKDDNRSAAALVKTFAPDQSVWWSLDRHSGEYYGLTFDDPVTVPGVFLIPGMTADNFAALSLPDLILTSKPETFDSDGRVAQYVGAHGYVPKYHFQAITGWVKPIIR